MDRESGHPVFCICFMCCVISCLNFVSDIRPINSYCCHLVFIITTDEVVTVNERGRVVFQTPYIPVLTAISNVSILDFTGAEGDGGVEW